jgi:hypothetical protein
MAWLYVPRSAFEGFKIQTDLKSGPLRHSSPANLGRNPYSFLNRRFVWLTEEQTANDGREKAFWDQLPARNSTGINEVRWYLLLVPCHTNGGEMQVEKSSAYMVGCLIILGLMHVSNDLEPWGCVGELGSVGQFWAAQKMRRESRVTSQTSLVPTARYRT